MYDRQRLTELFAAATRGDGDAANDVLGLVYDELRAMASARLAALPPGQTLQPTALVHEVYVKLAGDVGQPWSGRRQFFAAAARAMRNHLVDEARRKGARKREGALGSRSLDTVDVDYGEEVVDQIALSEALDELEASDPTKAEIVHLRYFAGLSIDETAEALGVAPSTVDLHWKYARALLRRALEGG